MATDVLTKGSPWGTGAKQKGILKHYGPASYTVVTTGTAPAGGDSVSASQFGLKVIESLSISGDNTGAYFVVAVPDTNTSGLAGNTYILRWFTAVGAVEVVATTNLSASFVKIEATGF
jgi:hypothetical protein